MVLEKLLCNKATLETTILCCFHQLNCFSLRGDEGAYKGCKINIRKLFLLYCTVSLNCVENISH